MTATAANEIKTDVDATNTSKAAAPAFAFKVKKHVTLPLLKIVPEKPLYVKFEAAIEKAKPQAGSRTANAAAASETNPAAKKKEPPELAHVIDLTTGEHAQIIIGTVLGAELRSTYADGAYVGKSFEIVQHKVQGKDYATYGITEIEVEAPATADKSAEKTADKSASAKK